MSEQTRRKVLATLGGTVAVGLAGCSQGGGGESTTDGGEPTTPGGADDMTTTEEPTEATETMTGSAMVRVAHMSPDAPNVDVFLDGSAVLEDVPFTAISDYLEVGAGAHDVAVAPAGSGMDSAVIEAEVTVEADTSYTIAAIGEVASDGQDLQPLVLEDDTSMPSDGEARVRLVHASPDAPAVDVTAGGGDVTLFDGAGFGDSATASVGAGSYTLQVRGDTDSNDGDVVGEFDVNLAAGGVYTVFAAGYLTPDDDPADQPFELVVNQDMGGMGDGMGDSDDMGGTANVRVAHMSPDAPNVDVFLDESAVLEDVPFRAVSDYLEVGAGAHDVAVAPTGAGMDSAVIDAEVSVEADTDYTIAAIGEVASDGEDLRPLVLEDPTDNPGGDQARLRVVHASPDAPAVDVTAAGGDVVLVDGAAYGQSAATTVGANDYTVQIRGDTDSNDGDVVADYDVSLNGGAVYTAFASGYLSPDDEPADEDFDLVVAQDASY